MGWFKSIALKIVKGLETAEAVALPWLDPVLSIVEAIHPAAAPTLVTVQTDFQRIFQVVHDAEVLQAGISGAAGGSGPEKLRAAAPLMSQEILDMLKTIGLKPGDDAAAYQTAIIAFTSAAADLANAVKPK